MRPSAGMRASGRRTSIITEREQVSRSAHDRIADPERWIAVLAARVPARRSSGPARSWPVAVDRVRRRLVLGAVGVAYVRALSAAQLLRARRAATMFPFSVWSASVCATARVTFSVSAHDAIAQAI